MGFGASSREMLKYVIQYDCITKLLTNAASFISIFILRAKWLFNSGWGGYNVFA